jgi:hypothetical protein
VMMGSDAPRMTTFKSMVDHMYHTGPIRL